MKTATQERLFSFLFQSVEYGQNMAGIPSDRGRDKAGPVTNPGQTDLALVTASPGSS
jgi:hypothetical protein